MSSQVNGRPTEPGGTVKDREIAAEQRYVDIAYARLEEMRADAQAMIREGYRQSLAGTKGSLVDRDAMVHQAALLDPNTAATLTTEQIRQMCDELFEAHGDLIPAPLRTGR